MKIQKVLLPKNQTLDSAIDIPFDVKRVYYMYDVTLDSIRGKHAHKKLKQALHCPTGSCNVTMDDGHEKHTYLLDSPQKILILEGLIWREIHDFTTDTMLCVLADELYDESDYIRSYDEFLNLIK